MGVLRHKNMCVTFVEPGERSDFGDKIFGEKKTALVWHEADSRTLKDPVGNERDVADKLVSDCLIPYGSGIWLEGDNTDEPPPRRALATRAGRTFRGQEVFETWL